MTGQTSLIYMFELVLGVEDVGVPRKISNKAKYVVLFMISYHSMLFAQSFFFFSIFLLDIIL